MAPAEYHQTWSPESELWVSHAALHTYAGLGQLQNNNERSKTPTGSLIAHTGLSPAGSGPIQLARSRNLSQTSEEMEGNDVPGSLSASPTSVRTPDYDSFELELPELSESVRNFYQFGDLSSHISSAGSDAMDGSDLSGPNVAFYNYSTQDVNPAFVATLPQPFDAQTMSINGFGHIAPQPSYHAPTFSQQLPQHEPWNTQRPLRNQTLPGSDALMFDPESDHVTNIPASESVDFTAFLNEWPNSHNNFNALMSPIASNASTQVNSSLYENQMFRNTQIPQSSPETSSLSSEHLSTLYPENSPLDRQPGSSPGATSTGAQSGQSPYQGPPSPMQSPSSEGVFSYEGSDQETMLDMRTQKSDAPAFPTRARNRSLDTAHSRHERVYRHPEPPETLDRPRARHHRHMHNRPGGRQLGSHLKPDVAKDAHDMRKVVACWHCVLQRDKCGPGDTCDRCVKRALRPNTDCGLGCSRVKLIELTVSFLPTIVTSIHEDSSLTNFVARHIQRWSNIEVSLRLTCGQGLPQMSCKVYEFLPSTRELLRQFQYITDPKTQKRVREEKKSPPLGMIQINHNDEKKYDKYVNDIVDNYLDNFSETFWAEDNNDFEMKLFKLMINLRPDSEDEAKLLKEVFRLIVVTFIMGHTITIVESTKEETLSRLHSYDGPGQYVENFCSPRMTNRQLKYFFSRLHRQSMQNVLNKLQQIFKSSKGCDKWMAAFCAVLGLAIAHEDNQKTIHVTMETKAASGEYTPQDAQMAADYACRDIDNKFGFIAAIFRWKYNRSCNPLRDCDHDWSAKLKDPNALMFTRGVAALVKENIDFLSDRQRVSVSSQNLTQYGARLTAQFLLSFWLPS